MNYGELDEIRKERNVVNALEYGDVTKRWGDIEVDILISIFENLPVSVTMYYELLRVCRHWQEVVRETGVQFARPSRTVLTDSDLLERMLFETQHSLTNVSFRGLSLGSIRQGTPDVVVDTLVANSKIRTLDLEDNGIWSRSCLSMGSALAAAPHLTTLRLSDNHLEANGARVLVAYLQHCAPLQQLTLARNSLGARGAEFVAALLDPAYSPSEEARSCVPYSQRQDVAQDGWRPLHVQDPTTTGHSDRQFPETVYSRDGVDDNLLNSICRDSLRGTPAIVYLDLSSNNVGDVGAKVLSGALPACPTVRSLKLASNNIRAEGVEALALAISRAGLAMETLDLSGNRIGGEGGIHVADMLSTNTAMRSLNLKYCDLREAGGSAIGRSLAENHTLHTLNLRFNNVRRAGLELADGLKANNGLRWLDLSNNGLGETVAFSLAEGIRENTTLRVLSLETNGLGSDGVSRICEAAARHPSLKSLDLADTRCGDAVSALVLLIHSSSSIERLRVCHNGLGASGLEALREAVHGTACTSLRVVRCADNLLQGQGGPLTLDSSPPVACVSSGNATAIPRGEKSKAGVVHSLETARRDPRAEGLDLDAILQPFAGFSRLRTTKSRSSTAHGHVRSGRRSSLGNLDKHESQRRIHTHTPSSSVVATSEPPPSSPNQTANSQPQQHSLANATSSEANSHVPEPLHRGTDTKDRKLARQTESGEGATLQSEGGHRTELFGHEQSAVRSIASPSQCAHSSRSGVSIPGDHASMRGSTNAVADPHVSIDGDHADQSADVRGRAHGSIDSERSITGARITSIDGERVHPNTSSLAINETKHEQPHGGICAPSGEGVQTLSLSETLSSLGDDGKSSPGLTDEKLGGDTGRPDEFDSGADYLVKCDDDSKSHPGECEPQHSSRWGEPDYFVYY